MKSLITICSAVLSFATMANVSGIYCSNKVTQFRARIDGDFIKVQVNHPYGSKYTAIYTKPVTSSTVESVLKAQEITSSLSNRFELSWPKENCKQEGVLIYCSIGAVQEVDGFDVKPLQFRTDLVRTKNIEDDFETIHVNMSFIIDQGIYRFAGVYKPDECSASTH